MLESYWKLRESPFGASRNLAKFYADPTHREALARLHFLVADGRSLGIVSGDSGSGKSLVLQAFANELNRQGGRVAAVSAVGLDEYGFLWTLAARLGARPDREDNEFELWRQISDRLYENDVQQANTAVLMDDIHHASEAVRFQIMRLLKSHQRHRVTIILAAERRRFAQLGRDLLQLSELRIHLEPWDQEDIKDYLREAAHKAGSDDPLFDTVAVERLHKISCGNPRLVSRLAELALVAGAGQQLEQIDSFTVDSVQQELTMAMPEPALGSVF